MFAEALKNESSAYVHLIEEKDDLLALTKWNRAVLCTSILSSPIFRKKRLEYSTKWILDHINAFKYEDKAVTFQFTNHDEEIMSTFMYNCIICKGFADGDDEKSQSTDLCITRSYDNRGSVYIIKLSNEIDTLDKYEYFEKVAVLMNVQKTVANDSLFKNYNE